MTPPLDRASRLLSGAFWNLLARVLSILLSLVAIRLLVESRGAGEYGLLVLSFNLLGYFSLAGLGMPAGTVKYVAELNARKDVAEQSRVVSVSYVTYLAVASLIGAFFVFLSAYGYRFFSLAPEEVESARRLFLMTGLWSICAWPMQVYSQVLQGLQEFRRDNLCIMTQTLVSNAGYVIVAVMDWPIEAALLALVLSQLVMYLMASVWVRRVLPGLVVSPSLATWGKFHQITAFSLWMMAIQLSGMVIGQTDQTLLALFVSAGAVTAYTIAATPMNTLRMLNIMVMGVVMPSVSEAHGSRDETYIRNVVIRGTRLSGTVMVALLAAGCAGAYPALYLWMGPEHAQNAFIAQLLMMAYAWAAAFSIMGQTLIGLGHVRQLGILSGISATINLAVSLALVIPLGILGVVLGTIVAYAVMAPFQVRLFTRLLPITTRQLLVGIMLPIYTTTAILGGLFWWIGTRLGPEPDVVATLVYLAAAGSIIPAVAVAIILPSEDRLAIWSRFAARIPGLGGR